MSRLFWPASTLSLLIAAGLGYYAWEASRWYFEGPASVQVQRASEMAFTAAATAAALTLVVLFAAHRLRRLGAGGLATLVAFLPGVVNGVAVAAFDLLSYGAPSAHGFL